MSTSISLAPHLQRALDAMSKDLALEPQALVNQAVFAWLRSNGYVTKAVPVMAEAPAPVVRAMPTPVPVLAPEPPAVAELVVPPAAPAAAVDLAPTLARMAEIDADLEKLTRPWAAWAPGPQEEEDEEEAASEEEDSAEEEPPPEEVEQQEEEEEAAPAVAAAPAPVEEEENESTIVLRSVPIALYLEREGEEPIRVTAERFIIGRGPHCDLVIDSPRVSREHVALTRKGILFYIEDLNSSNGTWFGEERVTTRELESGDVINLGNEPVTFYLRAE
ncbi:MAG: FHA domain-containing protein [Archangium sp.]|nr:FHA domain-containing protein [Archangium sp.]MDP3155724.1 FHA domain-containing protein [Archangium sp.]MDP3573966.1 FHA domain-containing protein [Archangium sp.]